ncbi:sugar-binding transcriptional regulator [Rhizobium sp. PAMB 3174]
MLHMVAKLHYVEEMAQVDIARRLGLSTATVSRMLQKARALGIVKIEVMDLVAPNEVAEELAELLGLKGVAVAETVSPGMVGALAAPLADLLKEAGFADGSVIGIGWGRAIREVISAGLPRLGAVTVVPLNGGLQQPAAHFQINEFVRQAAEQMGGEPRFLHAPYVSSQELRAAFLADSGVNDTVSLWDRLDCAIVGVGLPHPFNPPEASAATASEKALTEAAGDVIRHYFDRDGKVVPWEGEERMIAASREQLAGARLSIAVAASPEKAAGLIGAVRSGMVNAIVTDTATAQAIISVLLPARN